MLLHQILDCRAPGLYRHARSLGHYYRAVLREAPLATAREPCNGRQHHWTWRVLIA